MHNLDEMEFPELVDMLSNYTATYMKMLSEGASKEEFVNCRKTITQIQGEIRFRQEQEKKAAEAARYFNTNRPPSSNGGGAENTGPAGF
jgi:hypothetical protein